jgi:starch-binding outer membrane protein, SusD/RagB family
MKNIFKRKNIRYVLILSTVVFCSHSCKKFIQVDSPLTSISGSAIYATDAGASSVLTGLYANMASGNYPFATGLNSISIQCGLSADELTLFSGSSNANLKAQYRNALTNTTYPPFWSNLFQFVLTINSAVEGISSSQTITQPVKRQLLGEAKFMRAFCYFYLVNLYGDVPFTTRSDWRYNSSVDRTQQQEVWENIVADLIEAKDSLSGNYLDAYATNVTSERVRPTKWAAYALLARVYLYLKDYTNAEIQSDLVIKNGTKFSLVGLGDIFKKNSLETIWQVQPVIANRNTEDARVLLLTGAPNSSKPFTLSTFLLNSFEINDGRYTNWIGLRTVGSNKYYYPNKYKVEAITATNPPTAPSEYLMVLRLGEQYLIRAESRAMLNKLSESTNDLNFIRARSGLPPTAATDQDSLLSTIFHERQIELFTEWGHRWLDLKRTNKANSTMTIVTPSKGGAWNSSAQLYPIPLGDIESNPNLVQNDGY